MKKNKGAVSILLTMIVLAMITVIGAAGDVCSLAVAKSYAQRMNYMACNSVLAEYNSELFKDYGLMGFEGGKYEIKDLVEKYTSMMSRINADPGEELVIFDVRIRDISVDCSETDLCEKPVFMEQIRELMKLKVVEKGTEKLMDALQGRIDIGKKADEAKSGYEQKQNEEATGEGNDINISERIYDPEDKGQDRVLKSRYIIESLPSNPNKNTDYKEYGNYNLGEELELLKLGEDSSDFLNKFYSYAGAGADKFFLIDYADVYFKNAVKDTSGFKETFFYNEMEYLLKGHMSDSKNLSSVRRDLFLLRTALNLAHIYSDPEKSRVVFEAAAASGAGPYAAALQFVFAAAWAGVEASEDIERLFMGGKVPFIKENKDWKTDVESIFSDTEMISADYEGERGLDYTEYIKLLLITCDKEKLMERIMDLIQINMKGRYDMSFDLRNHITGFRISADYEREAFLPKVMPGIVEDDLMHIEEVFSY
ncbi:MAG: hypothetical protein IJC41_03145 [Firmicutes bacterium]|nr:hypothetical protein [Bacillota bacterium]